VEVAIGEVKVPIGVFDVAHVVADGDFEVGQLDVGIEPRKDHAGIDTRGPGGTGNAIKLQATPLQEGMADLSLDLRGPGVGIEVGWSVVAIEFDNFARRELGTGDRSFRELSVEHPVILLEDPGTTPKEFVVERAVI